MRKTPCDSAKNSLRSPAVTGVECNCCGFWEKRRMTDAHRNLGLYAINVVTGKAVRVVEWQSK